MRFDLRQPCKNCPFADTPTRIVFACLERAEEIEESAYRNGFPCHLSAIDTSDEDEEFGGYEPGPNTQHCVGAIGMFLNAGYGTWPGIDNRIIRADYSKAQAVAFDGEEAFFAANARDTDRSPKGQDSEAGLTRSARAGAEGIAP